MGLTKASTSGLLITAGLAQLLIALCAVSYFFYLRGDAHTETSIGSAVNAALADAPTPEASQLVPRAAPLGVADTVIQRELNEDSGVRFMSVASAREPQEPLQFQKIPMECAHVRITVSQSTYSPGDKLREA
jgi:hypothetical protein